MAHLGGYYNNPSEDMEIIVDMCIRMKGREWSQEICRVLNHENLVI